MQKKITKAYRKIIVIKSIVPAQGYISDQWNRMDSQKDICAHMTILLRATGKDEGSRTRHPGESPGSVTYSPATLGKSLNLSVPQLFHP